MTILIASHVPPPIRGLLKRWFIEPAPNVFVGSVNAKTRQKTLDYLRRNSPADFGLLVIYDDGSSQGFAVESYGDPARRPVRICGLELMAEHPGETPDSEEPPC